MDIHEKAVGIFVPDTLLATQYFDRIRRRRDLTGEQRLMCAIIEDSVEAYLKHSAASHPHHREIFAEAEHWIETQDRTWLFSFDTICDYLGLDSDYMRRGLRAAKLRARGEAASTVAVAGEPDTDDRHAVNE
jgi:hypothetical protein